MFPIEVDLDMVRRQRETGLKGLGQVLKSFRDRDADFSVYDRQSGADAYLHTLGPLEMPKKGTPRGLGGQDPQSALNEQDPRIAPGYEETLGSRMRNFSIFHARTGAD